MKKEHVYFNLFRLNLAAASFLALLGGLLQSAALLHQNEISPSQWPFLSVFLLNRNLTVSLSIALPTGLFLSLLFSAFRRDRNPSILLLTETLLVLTAAFGLALVKKYYTSLLSRDLAYAGFYVAHWMKTSKGILTALLIIWFTILLWGFRFPKFWKVFSWRLLLACLLIFAGVKAGVFSRQSILQKELSQKGSPSILLLTVDTLRADHLSSYGYSRLTSPHLDKLAEESALFTQALVGWPKTNQSFSTMMTGKYCFQAGVDFRLASFLPRKNLLLAEALKNAGYSTAAIISNANLSRYFNFADGFDEYHELWRKEHGPAQEEVWYDARRVTDKAVQWLEKNRDKKFFLWVHYIDPHSPYTPPAPYNQRFVNDPLYDRHEPIDLSDVKLSDRLGEENDPDYYIAQYDGEIRYNDEEILRLTKKLEDLNLKDKILLVFTSDHGESLAENNYYFNHGKYAYENTSHVPLFFRYPPKIQKPAKQEEVVSLSDLYPTLLDFAGISPPPGLSGESLYKALTGGGWTHRSYVFTEAGSADRYQRAVRTSDWKLIATTDLRNKALEPRFELYDLKKDPAETHNLAGQNLPIEEELLRKVLPWGRQPGGVSPLAGPEDASDSIDKEALEQLKSLGYVQ